MQAMQDMSVHELCALVHHLGVGYCADIFKEKGIDGEEFTYMKEANFVSLIVKAGAMQFTRANLFHVPALSR